MQRSLLHFNPVFIRMYIDRTTILFLALLLLLAAPMRNYNPQFASAVAEEPEAKPAKESVSADELERLVEDLDADRYATREGASQKLQKAGADALSLLADTADNGSYEASARALGILERWGQSGEETLQLPTLECLAALKNHPRVQKEAVKQLGKYYAASTLKTFIAKQGVVADFFVQRSKRWRGPLPIGYQQQVERR